MADNLTYIPSDPEFSKTGSNSNAADNNLDKRFIHQIRDQLFYIEIWMYNQLDRFKPFAVPFFFVEGLAIEETLLNWVTKGWIILSNDFEIIERGYTYDKTNFEKQQAAPFMFRSDGRNKISIKIKPINASSNNNSDNSLPRELWEMQYDFVIYDIEDLPTETAAKKLRKFYFWEERYQIFLERNIEWSTSTYAKGTTDILRSLPVANLLENNKAEGVPGAIESIIRTAASNSSNPIGQSDVKIGSAEGPKAINSPTFSLANFDKDNWDAGSIDSRVIYTSPANSCVMDDILYVSKSMKAADGSPLFLILDRYYRSDGKKWSLVPLSKYIKDASINQIERLLIEDNVNPTTAPPYHARAPEFTSSDIQNFTSGIASRISSYKFVPMIAEDDMNFKNSPVHSFDFSKGQFNVKFKNNTIKDFLTNMKKLAGTGLFSYQKSQQLLMNINSTKSTGLMHQNNFIPRTFYLPDASYVDMARNFIFLNQALNFVANGLTFRAPGKFVFIDRSVSSGELNPFDDRFLGQWMIVKVTHLFTKREYKNDIVATKIDAYTKWFNEIDGSSFTQGTSNAQNINILNTA